MLLASFRLVTTFQQEMSGCLSKGARALEEAQRVVIFFLLSSHCDDFVASTDNSIQRRWAGNTWKVSRCSGYDRERKTFI